MKTRVSTFSESKRSLQKPVMFRWHVKLLKRPTLKTFILCIICVMSIVSVVSTRSRYKHPTHGLRRHAERRTVPEPPIATSLSLVIPCAFSDAVFLPRLLESIAHQTLLPTETIVVLSTEGNPHARQHVEFMNSSEAVTLRSMIDSQYLDPPDEAPGARRSDHQVLHDLLDYLDSAGTNLSSLPNIRMVIAHEPLFAGLSRKLGVDVANGNIVSFFDMDDYMHPRRIEIVDRVFREHPDLDVFLHGYLYCQLYDCPKLYDDWTPTLTRLVIPEEREDFKTAAKGINEDWFNRWVPWDFELVKSRLPKGDREPNETEGFEWFFPLHMRLPNSMDGWYHNGWISLKREVAREVPFPSTPVGPLVRNNAERPRLTVCVAPVESWQERYGGAFAAGSVH